MIDVGHDTGFSRDFNESGAFATGRPGTDNGAQRGAAHAPASVPPGVAQAESRLPAPDQAASGRSQFGPAGDPPSLSAPSFAVRPLPDLGGLDLVALHALAGSSEPAAAIARQVADMAQGLAALADKLVGQPPVTSHDLVESDCIAFLEGQFRIRRLRGRHLPGMSLGEPAWDILLDLAIAHYWRRETSVTSLCIAADVPSTTALRWINSMTKAGVIVRRPCQRDGRRSFLAISASSYQAMLALAADALRTMDRVRTRYQRSAAA